MSIENLEFKTEGENPINPEERPLDADEQLKAQMERDFEVSQKITTGIKEAQVDEAAEEIPKTFKFSTSDEQKKLNEQKKMAG